MKGKPFLKPLSESKEFELRGGETKREDYHLNTPVTEKTETPLPKYDLNNQPDIFKLPAPKTRPAILAQTGTASTVKMSEKPKAKLKSELTIPVPADELEKRKAQKRKNNDNSEIRVSVMNPLDNVLQEVKVVFNIQINGIEIPFERTVVYKYNDDVKGEMYNYLDVVPEVTTSILDKVSLFRDTKKKYVAVKIKAGKDAVKGDLQLELPASWIVMPKSIPFNLDKKGTEQTVYFEVTPPNSTDEAVAKSIAIINNKRYDKEQIIIDFSHITKQQVLKTSEAKFIRMDLKTKEEKIAYIMGAGDEVPSSLSQMGYKVTLINPEEISPEKLANFDVVMTGVRAYNTLQILTNKQAILFDFVKGGKTMLVQYNTSNDLVTDNIAPFPIKLSRDRVTEENAEVRFLAPNHPVLNTPNKITTKDFEGCTY